MVPAKSHARERALVDAQLDPVDHPQVRGDGVSLREHDEVAHDELPRWEVVVKRLSRSTVHVCGTRSAGFSRKRQRYNGQPGWNARKGVLGRR